MPHKSLDAEISRYFLHGPSVRADRRSITRTRFPPGERVPSQIGYSRSERHRARALFAPTEWLARCLSPPRSSLSRSSLSKVLCRGGRASVQSLLLGLASQELDHRFHETDKIGTPRTSCLRRRVAPSRSMETGAISLAAVLRDACNAVKPAQTAQACLRCTLLRTRILM